MFADEDAEHAARSSDEETHGWKKRSKGGRKQWWYALSAVCDHPAVDTHDNTRRAGDQQPIATHGGRKMERTGLAAFTALCSCQAVRVYAISAYHHRPVKRGGIEHWQGRGWGNGRRAERVERMAGIEGWL